jgi:hypothetical protein
MKNLLSTILYLGCILAIISIAITNIYLLGLSEIICFPIIIRLLFLNFKNNN